MFALAPDVSEKNCTDETRADADPPREDAARMEAPIVPPRAMAVTDTASDADIATATVAAIAVVMAVWPA